MFFDMTEKQLSILDRIYHKKLSLLSHTPWQTEAQATTNKLGHVPLYSHTDWVRSFHRSISFQMPVISQLATSRFHPWACLSSWGEGIILRVTTHKVAIKLAVCQLWPNILLEINRHKHKETFASSQLWEVKMLSHCQLWMTHENQMPDITANYTQATLLPSMACIICHGPYWEPHIVDQEYDTLSTGPPHDGLP